ncbi:hypothetical protein BHE74_00058033 [Ensete ventricosum]|nr:hypothetical protein BHE74_00058033 [Ensete ventricosum]
MESALRGFDIYRYPPIEGKKHKGRAPPRGPGTPCSDDSPLATATFESVWFLGLSALFSLGYEESAALSSVKSDAGSHYQVPQLSFTDCACSPQNHQCAFSGDKRAKAAGAAAPSSAGSGAKRAGATVHSSLSPGRKGTGVAGGSDHKRVDGAGDAAPSSSSPLAPGPPDPGKAPSSTSSFCVLSSGVSDRFKNASQDFIEFDDSS